MTPRPIHRWKSFWLGLFVVISLVWASWDSTRTVTSLVNGKTALWRLDGATVVSWNFAAAGIPWKYARTPHGRHLTPGFNRHRRDSEKRGFRSIEIPDLPLILVTASLWGIWLILHADRLKKQKQNRHAAGST